ncbi:MAG: alpha/beta hydrolase family protein [Acidobacteriaceae bacterium]
MFASARRSFAAFFPFVFLLTTIGLSAQTHFPSNEDLRHIRAMSAPQLSPDGERALVQMTDTTAEGAKSHLWLVDLAQNSARQLTYSPATDKQGEQDAVWMPDGASILFLAKRGEQEQLFRLPLQGGEAIPYDLKLSPPKDKKAEADKKDDAVAIDVSRFAVAPDGRHIAIVAKDPQTAAEKKKQKDKDDAVWVDHDPHGTRVYLLALKSTGEADGPLTAVAVPADVQSVAWSPNVAQFVVLSHAMNSADDLGPTGKAWLVTANAPEHPEQLTAFPPTARAVVWSPDGKLLAFHAQAEKDAPPGYSDLYLYFFAGKSVHDLSGDFTGSIGPEAPIFTSDSKSLLQGVDLGVKTSIAKFDLAGGPVATLTFPSPVVRSLNTNRKQSGWLYLGSSSTQASTLEFAPAPAAMARTLKTPALLPESWKNAASQVVHWQNDGRTLEGLLYLPPQIAPGQHVPLIVDVHGGPLGAWSDDFAALPQFFLGHGWAVFRPNPRGSSGYGAAFAAANKNDLGGGDYRDILAGVDAMLQQFPVDKERLLLMGYSYGGEMAGFVEGKTTRFKAIVSGAPVIDQYSEYGTEGDSWYDRWYFGKPWERPADAWRQSPLAGAARASTPFLLLQGEADTTDPLSQSEEMYRALRQDGVPVELVTYPRENHGPLARGIFGYPSPEPWHGFDGRKRIVDFFEKALAPGAK